MINKTTGKGEDQSSKQGSGTRGHDTNAKSMGNKGGSGNSGKHDGKKKIKKEISS